MKILLLGDASNYHQCLGTELKRRGHEVTVASNGSRWMDTERDIDISRSSSKLGGALLWLKLNTLLWPMLKGYDIVQLSGIGFIEQRPRRIKAFFDRIRHNNGKVFLTALAADPSYVRMCSSTDCPLQYSEWMVGNEPSPYAISHADRHKTWLDAPLSTTEQHIYDNVDGVVTALYEYHLSCLRHFDPTHIAYAGIPIDTKKMSYIPPRTDIDKLRILWGAHKGREAEKGADRMLRVLKKLVEKRPDKIDLTMVQNMPFNQFITTLNATDIVVDQLYSYTPATTALMAMAKGKIVVSGGEEAYYDFIGEPELRPIINPDPRNINHFAEEIENLIDNPQLLQPRAADSRRLVERHNSVETVATRFESFWEKMM